MKILSITKSGREISRTRIKGKTALIGRSPHCEVILRAPNVKPVHFLLEWAGVDEKDDTWSVFNISASAKDGTGVGKIISEKPIEIDGYEFKWVQDRLMETALEGGALKESFNPAQDLSKNAQNYVLEVVTFNTDADAVTHVEHLATRENKIPHIPELLLEWKPDPTTPTVKIHVQNNNASAMYQKGAPVLTEQGKIPEATVLSKGGFVQINWKLKNHYFRFVPKINVPAVKSQFRETYFFQLGMALLITSLFLLFIIKGNFETAVKIKEPPRVAKIEVKEVVSPEPPLPKEEPTAVAPSAAAAPPAPSGQTKPVKQQVSIQSPAPKKDVNTVGLLGALKPKTQAQVKADMILNSGIVSDTVAGNQGDIVVAQPPVGQLSNKNQKGGLAGASTKLSMGDPKAIKGAGQIVGAGGKDGFNIGYDKTGSTEFQSEFSAEGGLDKESVRRTLMAYRKDIRTCYERALVSKPKIKGRILYKWYILPTGPVKWVNLQSSEVESPLLETCVKNVIEKIVFPKAQNKQATVVIYPFQFLTKN